MFGEIEISVPSRKVSFSKGLLFMLTNDSPFQTFFVFLYWHKSLCVIVVLVSFLFRPYPIWTCVIQSGNHQTHVAIEHLKWGWSKSGYAINVERTLDFKEVLAKYT